MKTITAKESPYYANADSTVRACADSTVHAESGSAADWRRRQS